MTTRLETAVVMATDLVGSTELASSVGSVAFDELRREHDSILADDVEDAGGRVVKNTGDGVLAGFPSAAAALGAAKAIQQHLERRGRTAAVALHVRIGISIGDTLVDEGDFFGITPIEATRLCASAAGGEILVADTVRATLRDRKGHRLESRGRLELKGLAEPVETWSVGWDPLPRAAGATLPSRLRGLPEDAYVGRAAEQRTLLESWDRAVDGRRQAVLISGEPGIGKTRLVTQTARTAIPDQAQILYGRCDEDQGMPYHPWLEILRDYARTAPRRLLRPYASDLLALVPELARKLGSVPPPRTADPDAQRLRLFNAVGGLLADASDRAPMLIVLDDLHWADLPTLQLFRHLVTASPNGRLMLLGTFRDSDVGEDHPLTGLLADLRRGNGATRIELEGLERADIVGLIETLAGHSIDAAGRALADRIHAETAGNPFFVGELVRHLRETGGIAVEPDGRWSFAGRAVERGLPQSVREVIGRRLQRLDPAARTVLSAGAVIGSEFDVELLARVLRQPAPDVLDRVGEAVAASLLTKALVNTAAAPRTLPGPVGQTYAFSHGLVQATLYETIPPGRRISLHQATGVAIEATVGDRVERLAELAHHFLEATLAGETARAVDYATRAGRQAMSQFAYDQAATLFARALSRIPPDRPIDQIGLLQLLGEAQMRMGQTAAARLTLFEAAAVARRHDQPEALARATLACGLWGLTAGVDGEIVALAEEAIVRLEGTPSPNRRLLAEVKGLLATALYFAPGRGERRHRLSAEAVGLARAEHEAVGSPETAASLAYVLTRAMLADWGTDSVDGDIERRELLDLCRQVGNNELELLVRNWRVNVLLERGDFPAFDAEVARVEHMATELRQPRAMVFLPLHRAMRAIVEGRFDDVERLNVESRELSVAVKNTVSELAAAAQILLCRMLQGRLPELEQPLRYLVGAHPAMAPLRGALVVLLLQAGRTAEARVEFDAILAPGLASIPPDNLRLIALGMLAEAAAQLGDRGAAAVLAQALEPFRGRWVVSPTAAALWPVERSLGVLAGVAGDHDRALCELAGVRSIAGPLDALPTLALAALDEARLLAARAGPGDAELAVERARDARSLAEHIGMRHLVAPAAALEAARLIARG